MESVILKDICEDIQYGYTTSAVSEEVGPKFLRITDIVPELIDWKSVPYCKIKEEEFDKYVLRDGDIVIARTGATTGYAKYLKKPPRAVFASYLIRIKIKDGIDKRFIGYIVQSQEYKDFIKTIWGGAAQPNANAQVLTSFPILLPSYTNQQKISAILSAYDDLIENNTRRIQILEKMAQRIYREWFVNFRFPGHKKVRFIDSELGKIPEGWEVSNLECIAELIKDKFREDQHNKLPLLDLARIPRKSLAISEFGKSDEIKTSRIIFKEGNILFGAIRPYFHKVVIAPCDGVTNVSVLVLKNKDIVGKHFLFNLLFSDEVVAWATQYSGGTKMPVINWKVFKTMKVVIPQREVIFDFESMADNIFNLIKVLTLKNIILKRTRDLLLPKLISGELDISDLDIVVRDINEEK